jgi:nucleotide-binding universal stress UspA family protein
VATIVLGYDGSGCARCALKEAVDLSKRLGDKLIVAYAFEPPGRIAGEEFSEHRRALEEIGEQLTSDGVERARAEGVKAEAALIPERPAEGLRDLAETLDARMIIVGTQGESPLRSAILGAVPHKLLQISPRPVLAVPPDERDA